MAKRMQANERASAQHPEDAILSYRSNAPVSPTHFPPNHTGPSRQPSNPRDGSDYGRSARLWQSSDMSDTSDLWLTYGRDLPRPTEGFVHTHPIGGMPKATAPYNVASTFAVSGPLMASSASLLHPRRTSAEEWTRHENEPAIPRNPLPLVVPSTIHASVGRDPLPHRDGTHITAPALVRPLPQVAATGDPDPPRARVACAFCRVRKLRCDGASPCRHCERRHIVCVYTPNKSKAKASGRGLPCPGEDNTASAPMLLDKAKSAEKAHPSVGGERGIKRTQTPTWTDINDRIYSANDTGQKDSAKRVKTSNDQPRHVSSGAASAFGSESSLLSLSSPSSSMPGSDLAMIQNNDMPIPMEPTFGGQDDWWNNLLGMLGRSRANSARLVQHLLTRFVQSNAVFFGLLHAPTLLSVVSGNQGHIRADPALYLAILAVSACDMHQHRIADERTSDMRSANEASRRLATRLSEMAANYLQTSTAHGSALTPSMGQAASILALTQPDGSTEQASLIRLAENVVRTLKLHETVSSREPLLLDSEPDSPLYWSRPLTSDSPESEVKYESIVRLCWTGISHRFRKYIAKPDEDFGDVDLPEYIQRIRPMAFWQPSLLPDDLPPPFFHSQDLMRRSAHLSRLTVALSKIEKIKEVEERHTPSPEIIEEVKGHLRSLDELEKAFVRHLPRSDAERHNVLGRTLQMFCRMHVWVRLTIWRKYRLWSSVDDASLDVTSKSSPNETEAPASPQQQRSLFQQHHPTIEFWLTLLQDIIVSMQQDFDAHLVDQTTLKSSLSDVDALARHVTCAFDLIDASGKLQPILTQVDGALNILKRVLAYAALNDGSDGLHITDEVVEKVRHAETRLYGLQTGEPNAHRSEPDAAGIDRSMDYHSSPADKLSTQASPVTVPSSLGLGA